MQTTFGRPLQGDALYLRDPMASGTRGGAQCPLLSSQKLLKLACLFVCFGLPDHAAELIQANTQSLLMLCNPHELLNILANEVDPTVRSYSQYIEKFSADPTAFYRSRRHGKLYGNQVSESGPSPTATSMPCHRWSDVIAGIGRLFQRAI